MSDSVETIGEFFKICGHVHTNSLPAVHLPGSYKSESMKPVACEAACIWDMEHGPSPEEENRVSSTAKHLEVEAAKHTYDVEPRSRATAETRYNFKPVTSCISLDFEGQVGLHKDSNFVRFSLLKSAEDSCVVHKQWPEVEPVGDVAIHEQGFICDNLVAGEEYCIELFAKVSGDDQADARSYLKVTFSDANT